MQAELENDHNLELLIAFIVMAFITVAYVFVVLQVKAIPAARSFFGHTIGIIGFILMLMTETLYSLRKRSLAAHWGRLSSWLGLHIFTGVVGPYMVLLHTSWKFNGLAGILMLATIIVVASGFIGRYIYTAIPRTADGVELENTEIQRLIADLEVKITTLQASHGKDKAAVKANVKLLKRLTRRRKILFRQMTSLATARRLLSLWHAIHIPIGLLLFLIAIFHIIGAIYYSTLIH